MQILTGDIGGTKCRFAIAVQDRGQVRLTFEETYRSAESDGLGEILSRYLERLDRPVTGAAAFGLPGPVMGRRCDLTNLPWQVDADQLAALINLPVTLLNDLEATAWGISALAEEAFLTLQRGESGVPGNRTVIAPGTGLGEAGMYWDGKTHHPFASEGGHSDFAPRNDLEVALLLWLRERHGRASWEHLLSGPGLVEIYEFLAEQRGTATPAWLQEEMRQGNPAEAVSRGADSGASPVCVESMQLFCRLYGAEAGNQALKMMATGGVYLGGGITPKIVSWLQQPSFLQAFRDKGKMRSLMERMPVRVILDDRAALFGPALKQFTLSDRAG